MKSQHLPLGSTKEDPRKAIVLERLIEKHGNYLSRKQFAEEIGVSVQTIRRAEKTGRLSPVRFSSRCIRYTAEDSADHIVQSMA